MIRPHRFQSNLAVQDIPLNQQRQSVSDPLTFLTAPQAIQLKLHGVQATATVTDSNFRMVHEQHRAVHGSDSSSVIAMARTSPEKLNLQQRIILDAYHQSIFMTLAHRKLMADFGVTDAEWKQNIPMFASIYAYPAGRGLVGAQT